MKVLKTIGYIVAAVLVVFLVLAGYFYYQGDLIKNKTYPVAAHHNPYTPDSAFIEHGKHVSKIIGCQECHGVELSGKILVDAPPFLVVPSNLTPGKGGALAGYDDQQLELLIRHGIKNTGKAVFFMPSFNPVNDYDLSALAAYLRQLPPVDSDLPTSALRPLGQILTGAGLFPYEMNVNLKNSDHPDFVKREPTIELGSYLTTLTCAHCHADNLKGGPHPEPGAPLAPSLAASAFWTDEQFATALRTGVTPEGKQLNGRYMPWPSFADFSDVEVKGIKLYVESMLKGDAAASSPK